MSSLKYFVGIIFLFNSVLHIYAQNLCDGNLGENVFIDGDFGSGSEQVLQQDPGIALGYFYNRNPPPFDGDYIITNNSAWTDRFGTWLTIGDNSTDPNGYMMVVNADFTPGIFFEQTVSGLCENTTYLFSADVINMIMTGVPDHLDPDVSFLLDDEVLFTTGQIPKTERWMTFGFTFTADPGQTEVKLTLINNAPGGIGNDLAIDNIAFRACGPDASIIAPSSRITLCPDSSPMELETNVSDTDFSFVQWQLSLDEGLNWDDITGANDQSFLHDNFDIGRYSYRFFAAQSTFNLSNTLCRIVSDTTIIEILPIEFDVIDTICEGAVFDLGPRQISDAGIFTEQLLGTRGCDSIVTLDLTVIPDPGLQLVTDVTMPSCFGFTDGNINVTDVMNGTGPFSFVFDGDTTTAITYDSLVSDVYSLAVVDRFLCTDDIDITVSSPDEFSIDLGEDREVLLGETIELNVNSSEQIGTFDWNPIPNDPECPRCETASFIPIDDITFQLAATNPSGCQADSQVTIRVIKDYSVFVPNSISPNGDNINDNFGLFAREGLIAQVEEFVIFDRLGNLLFETQSLIVNDATSGWDGKIDGEDLNNGTFVYSAKIRFIDQTTDVLSGSFIILN